VQCGQTLKPPDHRNSLTRSLTSRIALLFTSSNIYNFLHVHFHGPANKDTTYKIAHDLFSRDKNVEMKQVKR